MKTLDEVIKAYECCKHDDRCEDCPYNGITCTLERESDALHYLKHLQEYYEMSREHHEPNPPLTWDELKQMEGKPVWIEKNNWNHWDVVVDIWEDSETGEETWIEFLSSNDLPIQNYGKTWQAYRKERK